MKRWRDGVIFWSSFMFFLSASVLMFGTYPQCLCSFGGVDSNSQGKAFECSRLLDDPGSYIKRPSVTILVNI